MSGQTNPERYGGPHEVEITINGKRYRTTSGRHTVASIKELGGVPLADVLEEIIDGKLTPLPDDGTVEIRGGEIFVSHPRSGGAGC